MLLLIRPHSKNLKLSKKYHLNQSFYLTRKERFDYLNNSTYEEHSKSLDRLKRTAQIRRAYVFNTILFLFPEYWRSCFCVTVSHMKHLKTLCNQRHC